MRHPLDAERSFIDAATLEPSRLRDHQLRMGDHTLFETLLGTGLQRVRDAHCDRVRVWAPPIIDPTERALSVVAGGSISGPSIHKRPAGGVYQEGYSILLARPEDRRAQQHDGVAELSEISGVRAWIAAPLGMEMPFGTEPFSSVGVDIVVAHPAVLIRFGLAGVSERPGTRILPWVAYAVPAFGYGE